MKSGFGRRVFAGWLVAMAAASMALAQTDCSTGNDVLDSAEPKGITVAEVIQKFAANEAKVKEARTHYTYTQDVLLQTLKDNSVDGQFHEVTAISYDSKGNRQEKVTFAEQSTLRGLQMSQQDMEDIRVFMPLILATDDLPQYNVNYSGQQHVDDLDTYVFRVDPKKEEKNHRYFQGRIWVDNHDLEIVKVCGKTVPEIEAKKRKQVQELRPTFVTFRQLVDGHWFPAFVKVDDTLYFRTGPMHIREIVKFTGYKKAEGKP